MHPDVANLEVGDVLITIRKGYGRQRGSAVVITGFEGTDKSKVFVRFADTEALTQNFAGEQINIKDYEFHRVAVPWGDKLEMWKYVQHMEVHFANRAA